MRSSDKPHECQVTTLKDQEWWKKKESKEGTYLFVQHISNLQVADSEGYYHEVSNEGQRAGRPNEEGNIGVFDIACNPRAGDVAQRVKDGFLCILREKISNDLNVYYAMLEDMEKEGLIDKEEAKIDFQDVADKMMWKNAAVLGKKE